LVKKSLRQACGVIVSGEIGAKIVRSFNRKVYIIPQGIDIDKFCVTLDKKPGSFRKNIFMSGRVTDHTKGFQVLKEACEKLWKMRKDFVVTVTRQESIEKEPSFLRSVGWVSYEKMPSLYEKADICVFPSVWPEPFGRVAVEAMTAGKPVIASRIGGLKDIVVDGKTGFLVKPGDADELAKKIDILLDNPKLRDSMGKNGRERAERFYDWNTIIKKYYLPLFSNSRKRKTKHAQDSI
jgi:glycosyltransferase involved in cell wall biosynthesis